MKKIIVLEGQIDLFNMPIQEPIIKPKEKVIVDKQETKEDHFQKIINLYKESCNRIIKTVSGALLVELEDKTKYFDGQGVHEFDLGTDVGLIPADEILIVNQDKTLNEMQLKKLEEMNPDRYIKRKGDANIIVPGKKTTVITPRGWIIEWEQKPVYKEDEIILRKSEIKGQDRNLNVGDAVEFIYNKENHKGKIVSIYNNGETVNVVWNGKHTAFYYKCVKKIA
ncbi:hypothetical protein [Clostridium beijerinckii]|uniref:hypothetical protein n=2 Tax=Clostridium beijerinckii TaxID=1520 RepID=UPI000A1C77C9|nr:hypothetical protein [Clostridium beijerinckii]MBA8935547.1 signal peptidase I [Clostridium beijerinckii]NRU39942.1 signal peptidase I [Clostridium beijerinckii]NSA96779.1 signal peptidase I [Clostridium beijerinckii]CUU47320.1 conserved protein of unknown function [Clostridium beijerinckii]